MIEDRKRKVNHMGIAIKRRISIAAVLTALLIAFALFGTQQVDAASSESVSWTNKSMPVAVDNTSISQIKSSYITTTSSGYMRVAYDGSRVNIEYFDSNFKLIKSGKLKLELDIWGGFYEGSDAFYLIEGKNNTAESNSAEVVRVIKYDKNWNSISAASITGNPSIFGGEVRYPFDAGNVSVTESGNKLYIATGHEGYVDPAYNQGHQGYMMIEVDKTSMTGKIEDADLWHSFSQLLANDNGNIYVLEQSEGSRYTNLSRYDTAAHEREPSFSVLDYGGSRTSAWAIPCYASVDGIAVSSNNVLGIGTSIDQSNYDNATQNTPHNIYLTVTPKNNLSQESTQVKWLTGYKGDGKSFVGLHLTKINNNRFLVSWEEYSEEGQQQTDINDTLSTGRLNYMFINGNGDPISDVYTNNAMISDCEPIVVGNSIVYCASNANMVNFYSIDAQNGSFKKTTNRVAGENATWALNNGILTISGNGAITIDTEVSFRYPLSSVRRGYGYSDADNVWMNIRDNVKEIRTTGGITSIPERGFAFFDKLISVNLGEGLKSIGKEAFYSCDNLDKVVIPSSTTTIGDDIIWTGYYWTGNHAHVTYATIYAKCNSYAIKYAKANNISVVISGHDWGAPVYKWSSDYKSVTATRTCKHDATHKQTETVKTTSKVTKKATHTAKGQTSYTAVFKNTAFETQNKTVANIAKLTKAQPMTVKATAKTVKVKMLKKKAVTVKPITVKKAQGKVTYKLISGNAKSKKALKLNTKTGKITVKKGTKKGTYKIKVMVKAAGTVKYKAESKTVWAKVVVK